MKDMSPIQRRPPCRHFKGRDECGLGIDIRRLVGGPDWGWGLRRPCGGSVGKDEAACEKLDRLTARETEAIDAEVRAHDGMLVGHMDFFAGLKEKGPYDVNLTTQCPECGGKVEYSIASYNTHLWFRCRTKNCLAFIE